MRRDRLGLLKIHSPAKKGPHHTDTVLVIYSPAVPEGRAKALGSCVGILYPVVEVLKVVLYRLHVLLLELCPGLRIVAGGSCYQVVDSGVELCRAS